MALPKAIWEDCAGVKNDGKANHYMRDFCTSCAPFWERVPLCPTCRGRLGKLGRTKCKRCARFVQVEREGHNQ